MTKFYRTTIKVVVLSDTLYDPASLGDVAYDITEGDWSGEWSITDTEELTEQQAAQALREQGSDPSFFFIEEAV